MRALMFSALLFGCGDGKEPGGRDDTDTTTGIDREAAWESTLERVEGWLAEHDGDGLTIAVVADGDVIYADGLGVAV